MATDTKKPVTVVDDDRIHNVKIDTMSYNIINQVRDELKAKGMRQRSTSVIIRELYTDAVLSRILCESLLPFAGESGKNEGAKQVLDRLLKELITRRTSN